MTEQKLPALKFTYRNHKGEVDERIVDIDVLVLGRISYMIPSNNLYHSKGGWMISGTCRARGARRTFALVNIIGPITEVE